MTRTAWSPRSRQILNLKASKNVADEPRGKVIPERVISHASRTSEPVVPGSFRCSGSLRGKAMGPLLTCAFPPAKANYIFLPRK